MKVNSTDKNNISFNGFWNSKGTKKLLSFAADNGALFAATTTFALSSTIRPLSVLAAPKTDNENKKIACAKYISSGLCEFLLTLAVSMPIIAALKKINSNPDKFFKKNTIENFKNNANSLDESKTYALATQLFKLGLGFIVVVPKAILTTTGIPYALDYFFKTDEVTHKKDAGTNIAFKGKNDDKLAKGIAKILENKKMQNFATKYKDSNYPMHIFAIKDVFATGAFIHQANRSKKINDEQKPFLVRNSIISTILSIISSYTINNLTDKPALKIIEKIKKENKNDPKLAKYLEGFKIVKPIAILALVYYSLIPFISAFLAQKSKNLSNKKASC